MLSLRAPSLRAVSLRVKPLLFGGVMLQVSYTMRDVGHMPDTYWGAYVVLHCASVMSPPSSLLPFPSTTSTTHDHRHLTHTHDPAARAGASMHSVFGHFSSSSHIA